MGPRRSIELRGSEEGILFEIGWRNNCLASGLGNIDIESINYSDENEFRTTTAKVTAAHRKPPEPRTRVELLGSAHK